MSNFCVELTMFQFCMVGRDGVDPREPVAYAGKKFGGGVQGRRSGLVGGPGGGAPRTPENFGKFAKKFPKKFAKMLYFRLFCKKISKSCVKFSRVWTKNTIVWEILRKF